MQTKFELSQTLLNSLQELIEQKDNAAIKQQLEELYPADIAEILHQLNFNDAKYIYFLLDDEISVQLIAELEDDIRLKLLSDLPPEKIAEKFIENLASDEAADIINELPKNTKESILKYIKNKKHAQDILALLYYDNDTAGGLMAKELICANINWTVSACIEEIRKQSGYVGKFYAVYVVNDENLLLGKLSLDRLIISPVDMKIKDLYDNEIISVTAHTDSEEVVNIMKKYDIISLPVVDVLGKLIGRITIDDVVDVIKEEAEKDIQMMSGISEKVDTEDKVWVLSRARLPWLLIGLMGGILSSRIIGAYETQIQINPDMAFFIPLIAAMGGNAGVQSSAIVVQGLANNTYTTGSISLKLFKELLVSMLNGLICSTVIFIYNFFIYETNGLAITVSVALLLVIVFASIWGSFIPIILNRFKIDPALATGPFITTTNDIFGLILYFFIGRLLYNF